MELKSYRSHSVEDAIRLARLELGGDALFVGSRPLQPSEDRQAGHEVTFVVIEPSAEEAVKTRPLPAERNAEWLAARLNGLAEESAKPARVANKTEAMNGQARSEQSRNGQPRSATKPPLWQRMFSPKTQGPRGQPWQPREISESGGQPLETSLASNGTPPVRAPDERPAEPPVAHPAATERDSVDDIESWRAVNSKSKNVGRPHWREFLPAGLDAPKESEPLEPPAEFNVAAGAGAPKDAEPTRGVAQTAPAPVSLAPGARAPVAAGRKAAAAPRESASNTALEQQLTNELRQIRALVGRALSRPPPLFAPGGKLLSHPRLAEIYGRLTSAEVEPALAAQLVDGLEEAARQGADRKRLRALLHAEFAKLWKLCGPLGKPDCAPRIVALVGPSGVGKTTSLGKLAVRFGVVQGRRVHLVSVDQQRVGAVELLQAYAELLGAPLTIVEECEALPEALRSLTECEPRQRPELVLIDTCGYGPADWARARRLAGVFAARADIDVHLVLSLALKCSDLRRTVERYRVFQPDRLLFTKADETDSHGALLNESVRSGLPLSYVTNGQRVPEDITPASAAYLTRLLLKNDLMQ